MKKNNLSNKEVKKVVIEKPTKPTSIEVDITDFADIVKVITIKDSKHLIKGVTYEVGKETAGILIGKGLVELVK